MAPIIHPSCQDYRRAHRRRDAAPAPSPAASARCSGIGGGVFLVPFLNLVLGLDFKVAVGDQPDDRDRDVERRVGGDDRKSLINLRLGMLLEVASAAGGLAAGLTRR